MLGASWSAMVSALVGSATALEARMRRGGGVCSSVGASFTSQKV